jgi:UDP-N-acetylmuramate--alanine ligase
MSGIAEILLNLGFEVSGSDLQVSAATRRLSEMGATVYVGHRPEQIADTDVVVYSSAVTEANPEIAAARSERIPVIRRAEMLAELMRLKYGIVIAGSHGKTTTTSLVAAVLAAGGLDPTVVVGGRTLATGSNARLGEGEYLVAEADESDGSFLRLTPTVAVVTNIDFEHVDYYTDLETLREAFVTFLGRVPFYGACVLCVDDPEVRALAPQVERKVLTYGLGGTADIRIDGEIKVEADGIQVVDLCYKDRALGTLRLPVRGRHNLQNALAAVAVGTELGITWPEIKSGLADFQGVKRRCEERGEHGGVLVLDDYGHHPTEVLATLEVARSFARRVVVLFQPHRYSRTAHFSREFADALALADCVGLLPIYAASENPLPGVSSELIASALADKKLESVEIVPGSEEVPAWLDRTVRPGDLLLTLGAGDIGRMVETVCEHCAQRS